MYIIEKKQGRKRAQSSEEGHRIRTVAHRELLLKQTR